MTVWHGSSCAVAENHVDGIRRMASTDVGASFGRTRSIRPKLVSIREADAVTLVYEQALSFTHRFKRRGQGGIISRYSFDEAAAKGLDVLCFASYSDEWLAFVLTCRTGRDTSAYDIVSGGVANDRVFNTRVSLAKLVAIRVANSVELYLDQLIDRGEALRRLQYEKPNEQLCLRTASALNLLHFEGSESV